MCGFMTKIMQTMMIEQSRLNQQHHLNAADRHVSNPQNSPSLPLDSAENQISTITAQEDPFSGTEIAGNYDQVIVD